MPTRSNIRVLTGTRIRHRRADLGLRQAEVARAVDISPSYLNLIEHNRRNIAGKLLSDIARVLDVDASVLAEGAETALVSELRAAGAAFAASGGGADGDAPARTDVAAPELSRTEEFTSRFPGWAATQAAAHRRIAGLERMVETLSDRLTHDPYLSDALHDMLSVVTAIRSTAGILAGDEQLDPVWQRRFQKNLHEDALRLSQSSETLVRYLDQAGDAEQTLSSPQEELDACFARLNWHVSELELLTDDPAETKKIASGIAGSAAELSSDDVREMAATVFEQYAADARILPLDRFVPEARHCNWDPAALSAGFGVPLEAVMRRLAALPPDTPEGTIGRLSCDGAGSLIFRKPPPGFAAPRFGGGCALWPLYQALGTPGQPVCRVVTQDTERVVDGAGGEPTQFLAYACAFHRQPDHFGAPVLIQSHMVLIPSALISEGGGQTVPGLFPGTGEPGRIGSSCRVCLRNPCQARREPSILSAPPAEPRPA